MLSCICIIAVRVYQSLCDNSLISVFLMYISHLKVCLNVDHAIVYMCISYDLCWIVTDEIVIMLYQVKKNDYFENPKSR